MVDRCSRQCVENPRFPATQSSVAGRGGTSRGDGRHDRVPATSPPGSLPRCRRGFCGERGPEPAAQGTPAIARRGFCKPATHPAARAVGTVARCLLKRGVFGFLPSHGDGSPLFKVLLPPRADLTEGVEGAAGGGGAGVGAGGHGGVFVLQEDSSPYERINPRVPFKQNVPRILKEDSIYKKLFSTAAAGRSRRFTWTGNRFLSQEGGASGG